MDRSACIDANLLLQYVDAAGELECPGSATQLNVGVLVYGDLGDPPYVHGVWTAARFEVGTPSPILIINSSCSPRNSQAHISMVLLQ